MRGNEKGEPLIRLEEGRGLAATADRRRAYLADPRDVETALALALTSGKALARTQSAETMSKVVAERLVAICGD